MRRVFENIGNIFGFRFFIWIFDRIDYHCVCHNCPTTTSALSVVWKMTKETWKAKVRKGVERENER